MGKEMGAEEGHLNPVWFALNGPEFVSLDCPLCLGGFERTQDET